MTTFGDCKYREKATTRLEGGVIPAAFLTENSKPYPATLAAGSG